MEKIISVIVPTYNIENEINRCVQSIIAQTYQQLEIILVDDGSTDGTLAVLEALGQQDSRIRVIHQENGGVTRARLTGVKVSQGEWIGFVDGDDYIEPDMFERLLNNASRFQADISHCGYQMVFPSRVDMYYNTGRHLEQDNVTGLKDLLSGEFVEPGLWNKLFRRRLFEPMLREKLMDCSIKNTEDLLMNYYLFSQSRKSVYEDFCPYHYIVRQNSAANRRINKHLLLDPLTVIKQIHADVQGKPELYPYVQQRLVRQLINLTTMSDSEDRVLIAPIKKNAKAELRQRLRTVVNEKACNKKLKLMAVWAAISPYSYYLIHTGYRRVTGSDRKYEIS